MEFKKITFKKLGDSQAPTPLAGRPCLLTKERQAQLLYAIEEGLPLKQAAMIAGICYETFNRWRIKGEKEDAPLEFRHFCQALQRSQAIAMQRLVSLVQNAGKTDWKAAAWMLERRHPEEFCRPQRVEHSGPKGAPISTVATIEPEVLQRIKKQAAVVEVTKRLAAILAENRRKKLLVADDSF